MKIETTVVTATPRKLQAKYSSVSYGGINDSITNEIAIWIMGKCPRCELRLCHTGEMFLIGMEQLDGYAIAKEIVGYRVPENVGITALYDIWNQGFLDEFRGVRFSAYLLKRSD